MAFKSVKHSGIPTPETHWQPRGLTLAAMTESAGAGTDFDSEKNRDITLEE